MSRIGRRDFVKAVGLGAGALRVGAGRTLLATNTADTLPNPDDNDESHPITFAGASGLKSSDLYLLRSVREVRLSPDGERIAYTVVNMELPGPPYSQVWVMNIVSRESIRLGGLKEPSSDPDWSPDGQWISYAGGEGDKAGLWVSHPDGSGARFLAPVVGTNTPVPGRGRATTWSPDSKRIAFVSATPGPETAAATGDPIVITRYLYKPNASEGLSHFNDNRRLHIFVVDPAARKVRQLTGGTYNEHSIDWSPSGEEILFASNREPNADEFFHYNIFALRISDGLIRRLTTTESTEYVPRWSPDGQTIAYLGTKRGLTDRETNMENTHVWLMNADGSNQRELSSAIDNRAGEPGWTPDGSAVYFTVEERGSVHLYRLPVSGGQPEVIVNEPGVVGSWSVGGGGMVVYSLQSARDFSQLYLKTRNVVKQLTDLNAEVLAGKQIAEVEPFTFISNDHKYGVEAFLTKPLVMTPNSKHPLIVDMHGGPHSQQGPAFNFKVQVFAARGWATLQVNYRGSAGYGQKFEDAIFGDQDGNEAQDVLYGVSAAVRRNLWIDRERMGLEGGSYGGQLTDWLVTQTNEFKAAISIGGISNLISFNYTAYYNQYLEMEFGQFVHQDDLMDILWERSALKHVANVHTPIMLMHGENDSDVPIGQDEQFYIALKDVGVETIMVIYPREGHDLRETKHIIDLIDRSVGWYEKHFQRTKGTGPTNVQP